MGECTAPTVPGRLRAAEAASAQPGRLNRPARCRVNTSGEHPAGSGRTDGPVDPEKPHAPPRPGQGSASELVLTGCTGQQMY